MSITAFDHVLEQLQEKGTPNLSPTAVAERLSLQIQELATDAGVHRNTVRIHPESPRLQQHMRGLLRVLSAIVQIQPDPDKAVFFFRNTPIPAFRHKTAYDLATEGRADDVVNYLTSIQSGFVG